MFAPRHHVGQQNRLGVAGNFLGNFQRHHNNPIVVATDRPSRSAQRLAPLPRWAMIILSGMPPDSLVFQFRRYGQRPL